MENSAPGKDGQRFTLKKRIQSFRHAISGILVLVRDQHNFRIHLFILALVIVSGLALKISFHDWIALVIVSGLVLASESLNSAVEYLSDRITGNDDEIIRKAKDVAAAGVLISALAAIITGMLIFVPRIISLFR